MKMKWTDTKIEHAQASIALPNGVSASILVYPDRFVVVLDGSGPNTGVAERLSVASGACSSIEEGKLFALNALWRFGAAICKGSDPVAWEGGA
jgi:hypothetical protein